MPRIPRSEIRKMMATYPAGERFETALAFAMSVINDPDAPLEAKLRLARAVLPFQETAEEAAEAAARGPFAPPPLPRKPS
jgi:hypothetical protein